MGGETLAWVRPINSAHGGAISDYDKIYEDKSHAELLDIVTIVLEKPVPHLHHQEDHQIDPKKYWVKTGRATWQQVLDATDTVKGPLWSDGDDSFHGRNDKVSEEIAATLKCSLYLIAPTRLDLVVGYESVYQAPDARRVRADFDYNGTPYNFVVTDPVIEEEYFAKGDGTYRIKDARLCIGLAEIFHGSATKLVAAVITSDRD